MRVKYYDFVAVSLPQLPGMQIAPFLFRIILPSVVSLTLFSTLCHKRHDFRKKNVLERAMCGLVFSV